MTKNGRTLGIIETNGVSTPPCSLKRRRGRPSKADIAAREAAAAAEKSRKDKENETPEKKKKKNGEVPNRLSLPNEVGADDIQKAAKSRLSLPFTPRRGRPPKDGQGTSHSVKKERKSEKKAKKKSTGGENEEVPDMTSSKNKGRTEKKDAPSDAQLNASPSRSPRRMAAGADPVSLSPTRRKPAATFAYKTNRRFSRLPIKIQQVNKEGRKEDEGKEETAEGSRESSFSEELGVLNDDVRPSAVDEEKERENVKELWRRDASELCSLPFLVRRHAKLSTIGQRWSRLPVPLQHKSTEENPIYEYARDNMIEKQFKGVMDLAVYIKPQQLSDPINSTFTARVTLFVVVEQEGKCLLVRCLPDSYPSSSKPSHELECLRMLSMVDCHVMIAAVVTQYTAMESRRGKHSHATDKEFTLANGHFLQHSLFGIRTLFHIKDGSTGQLKQASSVPLIRYETDKVEAFSRMLGNAVAEDGEEGAVSSAARAAVSMADLQEVAKSCQSLSRGTHCKIQFDFTVESMPEITGSLYNRRRLKRAAREELCDSVKGRTFVVTQNVQETRRALDGKMNRVQEQRQHFIAAQLPNLASLTEALPRMFHAPNGVKLLNACSTRLQYTEMDQTEEEESARLFLIKATAIGEKRREELCKSLILRRDELVGDRVRYLLRKRNGASIRPPSANKRASAPPVAKKPPGHWERIHGIKIEKKDDGTPVEEEEEKCMSDAAYAAKGFVYIMDEPTQGAIPFGQPIYHEIPGSTNDGEKIYRCAPNKDNYQPIVLQNITYKKITKNSRWLGRMWNEHVHNEMRTPPVLGVARLYRLAHCFLTKYRKDMWKKKMFEQWMHLVLFLRMTNRMDSKGVTKLCKSFWKGHEMLSDEEEDIQWNRHVKRVRVEEDDDEDEEEGDESEGWEGSQASSIYSTASSYISTTSFELSSLPSSSRSSSSSGASSESQRRGKEKTKSPKKAKKSPEKRIRSPAKAASPKKPSSPFKKPRLSVHSPKKTPAKK